MNIPHARLLIVVALLLASCGHDSRIGPPELRLGSKECAACGMLVSEDRCSSAVLVEERGRRQHQFYDDLGCMLDQERDGMPGQSVVQRYAHDYNTRSWVRIEDAWFLFTDPNRLMTPMGSGIAAFSSHSAVEAAQARYGGKIHNYTDLAEARRIWMEARYGRVAPGAASPTPNDPG